MATVILIALLFSGLQQPDPAREEPNREKVDLPGFEQGDLYVLGRLSNRKLVNVERSEWVFVAILIRDGLDRSFRREAIAELAELRRTDRLTQILDGITRAGKNAGGKTGALSDLIGFLMTAPAGELKKKRDTLLRFATDAIHELLRRAGYAAMILADGAVDPSWRLAEKSKDGLVDLLGGILMIPDPKVRAAFYPKVEPLLHNAPSRGVRQAAILAIASVPGRVRETFALLAALVQNGTERDTAIQALQNIPSEHWPKDEVHGLVDSVMKYLKGVDPTRRNAPTFKRARQVADDLASVLPVARGREVRKALESLGIRVVTIRAVPYSMRYDRVHIAVQAGTPIEITFENPDTWLHNLVIVAPGALQEIGIMASQMFSDSASWNGRQYVPNSDKVVFATRMVDSRQAETLTLVAPKTVGEYPYLCTYPGHWVSMRGVLHVVDDVDAWIAANPDKATGFDPDARPFVQTWRLDDLVSDLDTIDGGRSLERGKELFTAATCVTCHQVQKVGGAIGPNLTEATKRLKPSEMLAEIVEPSKTINEKYRAWVIVLKDGRVLSGVITKQDPKTLHLVVNPLSSAKPIEIPRDQIQAKRSSNVSTMPMGLLNTLTREEILDLLAYIRSDL